MVGRKKRPTLFRILILQTTLGEGENFVSFSSPTFKVFSPTRKEKNCTFGGTFFSFPPALFCPLIRQATTVAQSDTRAFQKSKKKIKLSLPSSSFLKPSFFREIFSTSWHPHTQKSKALGSFFVFVSLFFCQVAHAIKSARDPPSSLGCELRTSRRRLEREREWEKRNRALRMEKREGGGGPHHTQRTPNDALSSVRPAQTGISVARSF